MVKLHRWKRTRKWYSLLLFERISERIQIFKVKDGVNGNPEDPNYDLLELSCRVTAKRFFPNFVFLDATYNQNDKWNANDPERWRYEVATMGWFFGSSKIAWTHQVWGVPKGANGEARWGEYRAKHRNSDEGITTMNNQ